MRGGLALSARFWVVLPAAGSGRRMGGNTPKQYLPLAGKPVIEHSVERFGSHPRISGVVVVIAATDKHWAALRPQSPGSIWTAVGGAERCHSVLSGLQRLREWASPADWVLVHDAARPCVRRTDIDLLLDRLGDDPVGGLLALPVFDTLKRADPAGVVSETVPREGMWRALTPQMFRLEPLMQALLQALQHGQAVTDEAAAMELAGARPRIIPGHRDNIKITCPEDLDLAEWYLRRQQNGH
jgi:2-C-methyl-D-erythritol 4-phosphate cytidylyltransferase